MNTKPASFQTFTLADLEQFTKEGRYSTNASKDFHLFYVGRDDVHDILKYLLSRASTSLYLNMFGYDDDEVNEQCMRCAKDPTITRPRQQLEYRGCILGSASHFRTTTSGTWCVPSCG